MKDFVSGRDIDMRGLMEVARCGEAAAPENFDMSHWWCRTAGCLIGTFCQTNRQDRLRLRNGMPFLIGATHEIGDAKASHGFISQRFGLSIRESAFLFVENHGWPYQSCSDARDLTQKEALRRLRKFMYYKMRKSEFLEDYDAARHAGDINVAAEVNQSLAAV